MLGDRTRRLFYLFGLLALFIFPTSAQDNSRYGEVLASDACETLLQIAPNKVRRDIELVERCAVDLPSLSPAAQIDFSNRYLRAGFSFLTPELRTVFAERLTPEAARKLASAATWADVTPNNTGISETVDVLYSQAIAEDDELSTASLLFAQARLARDQKDYELMGSLLDEALELADRNEMVGLSLNMISAKSIYAQGIGEILKALEFNTLAFDGFWELEAFDRASRDCNRIGLLQAEIPDISIEILDNKISQAARDQDPKLPCYYLGAGQLSLIQQSNAKPFLEKALSLAEAEGLVYMSPLLINMLGDAALKDKEYADSVELYERALKLYEEDRKYSGVAEVYNTIGIIFSELRDYDRALEFYQKGVDVLNAHDPNNAYLMSLLYGNMGVTHNVNDSHASAIEYLDLAQSQNEEVKRHPLNVAFINRFYADSLHELGETARAMELAKSATDQFLQYNQMSQAGATLSWLGKRYLEQDDISEANVILTQALEAIDPDNQGPDVLLSAEGDEYWHMDFAQSMSVLLSDLDKPAEALQYAQVAMALSEQRLEDDKLKAIANMDIMFRLRDRDRDVELLRQQALVADLNLRQSQNRNVIGFLIAVLSGLTALLLYRSYRSQRKIVDMKDVLLSEIHHRTKNNLQLLSSLLSLDARRSGAKINNSDGRRDAANRAQTMALVHSHIYERDKGESTEGDVRPFLNDLIDLMQDSHQQEGVRLEHDIVSAMVDVDLLTPLGLIVCELISNAYKHAFGTGGGVIRVSLTSEHTGLKLTVGDNGRGFDVEEARTK
ncbi:MAG: tetratricopeptide repeat protein, partial [Pseudomonadota bacterium]